MARETRDILIGLATLAALGLVLAYLYGGRQVTAEAGQMQLSAAFNRVDGLFVGDPVYVAGIQVGKVERMMLDNNFRAVVDFSVRNGVKLPTDSSASIQTNGLFGSKFVLLQPGGEMDDLKSGDRISYTQDAVVVSDLLDLIISEGKAARAKEKKEDAAGAGNNSGNGAGGGASSGSSGGGAGFIVPLGGSGQ